MGRNKALLSMAVLAVMLAGCAGNERTPGAVTFESPAPKSVSSPASESKLLAFKAPKLGGGQVEGGELKDKDVAIWFWAPW